MLGRGKQKGLRIMARNAGLKFINPPQGRKTIEYSELWKRSFCNSKTVPVSLCGRRMEYVGIGWIDAGPERGDEPVVVENGKMPTKGALR